MDKKLAFLDMETTGLDPVENDIVEIGYVIDINKTVVEEGILNMAPHNPLTINPESLEIHHKTILDVSLMPTPHLQHRVFLNILGKHVDKYNKNDKYWFVAYNAKFDFDFLWNFFLKCDDEYFGSWFLTRTVIDVREWFVLLAFKGIINFKDYKLGTLASEYGLTLDAHNALSDIQVTRQLFYIAGDLLNVF